MDHFTKVYKTIIFILNRAFQVMTKVNKLLEIVLPEADLFFLNLNCSSLMARGHLMQVCVRECVLLLL